MKKIFSLIVLLVALSSCEEDVKFNNPTVQGLKDDALWRAVQFSATQASSNGALTVTASNGFETLTLKAQSATPGTYDLGVNETNKASFVFSSPEFDTAYQTGAGIGDGELTISALPTETNVAGGFITGNFKFNAVDDEGNTVNFRDGVFYKVPIYIIP
jgi:hypothetical protein